MNQKTLVIGEGLSAVCLVAQLAAKKIQVSWVKGNSIGLEPVGSFLSSAVAVESLLTLKKELGILEDDENVESGFFTKEYKNKSFKTASWFKSTEVEEQERVFKHTLSLFEQQLLSLNEFRVSGCLQDHFVSIKNALINHPFVEVNQGAEVRSIEVIKDAQNLKIKVGFTEKFVEYDQVVFCESPSVTLSNKIIGFPHRFYPVNNVKNNADSFLLMEEISVQNPAFGVLQLSLDHSVQIATGFGECLVLEMHKDVGEPTEKRIIGGFYNDGYKSVWTVALEPEVIEDTHLTTKRLKKLKQALNRIFTHYEWIGEMAEKKSFTDTVAREMIRVADSAFVFKRSEELPCYSSGEESNKFLYLVEGFSLSDSLIYTQAIANQICESYKLKGFVSQAKTMDISEAHTF